ncbi:MAG: conjugal transfer protein TraD [Phenylobacterium sp.]|nr:conjugal transfer protein TraD [Phenylobacterium sp.]
MHRRDRTRQLIELGGLVQKAGLVELGHDDRAALLGAFLGLADQLVGPGRDQALATWRHRGRRAFEADQVQGAAGKVHARG